MPRLPALAALWLAAGLAPAWGHGKATPVPNPAPSPTPEPTPPPGRIAGKISLQEKDGVRPGEGTIVYLEHVAPELWPEGAGEGGAPPRITMKDKKFEPRALAVLADRPVAFPNLDPVFHNVFSLSGKNKFDLGLYKDGKSKDRAFAEPGIVRVFCNIHPSMTAFLVVVQNPWWTSAGPDGTYQLADVPPGSYRLKVWHERGGESSRPVAVAPGATSRAEFELDARNFKVLPHKNKFGKDYGRDGY